MLALWFLAVIAPSTLALDNGLALTPPMGWLTWLKFGCNIDCDKRPKDCLSEDLIKRTADRMVSDGYRDAGYEYVIIDDCWLEKERDANGRMVPDRKRFKSGMKALADYLHERKLKFGIYQDIGTYTCQKYPGEKGHEDIDIQTFVEWEVDYLKLDGCYMDKEEFDYEYPAYSKKLNASGRPIVFSCSWPAYQEDATPSVKANYSLIAKHCNLWRNYGDIDMRWTTIHAIIDWFGDNQDRFIPYAGPGHWNDPDTLVVGNPEINEFQAHIQMAVWAIMASPLQISADLDTVPPEHKKILLDKELIKINQDPLGKQGSRVFKNETFELWQRELQNDKYVMLIIMMSNNDSDHLDITFEQLNIPQGTYTVQDLYEEDPLQTLKWGPMSVFRSIKELRGGVKLHLFTPVKYELDGEDMEKNVNIHVNNEINSIC